MIFSPFECWSLPSPVRSAASESESFWKGGTWRFPESGHWRNSSKGPLRPTMQSLGHPLILRLRRLTAKRAASAVSCFDDQRQVWPVHVPRRRGRRPDIRCALPRFLPFGLTRHTLLAA